MRRSNNDTPVVFADGFPGWNGETPNTPRPGWAIEEYLEQLVHTAAVLALPPVTEENNGDFMTVVDGEWAPADVTLDEKIAADVDEWLEDHPEATTTVQDGAITFPKLAADLKSLLVHDTVSGPVASFDYAAGGLPFDSVIATLFPIQDLHGYSHPWPAGGGKNLIVPLDRSFTNNGVPCVCSASAETISLKGTANNSGGRTGKITKDVVLPAGTYILSVTAASGTSQATYIVNRTDNNTFISSGQFSLAEETSVYVGANVLNGTVYDEVVHIQIEFGSTATDWTPYENICPISGRTGLSVYRTGKNLFDQSDTTYLAQDTRFYGANDNRALAQINTLPAGTYTLSFSEKIVSLNGIEAVPTKFGLYLEATNDGQTFKVNAQSALITPTVGQIITKTVTFTLTDEYVGKFQDFRVYTGKNGSHGVPNEYTANIYDVQIELGSATTYEPYNGNTYAVDWTSQAGTVYGGTLDVVTGVLTVTMAEVDLGTLNWSMTDGNVFYNNSIANKKRKSQGVICSNYANPYNFNTSLDRMADKTVQNRTDTDVFYIKDSAYSDPAAFKAAMSGVQLCYELATPLTYQLTPKQIAALTENYVWASNGGNVSVTFIADTKSYIDRKIAEAMAAALNA